MLSRHSRPSPSFAVTAGELNTHCHDHHAAAINRFRLLLQPLVSLIRIVETYILIYLIKPHLSVGDLFMTIFSPKLIVFVFRCNHRWTWYVLPSLVFCYVRLISSFSWRHFHLLPYRRNRSSPPSVATVGGLSMYCRDKYPDMSDQASSFSRDLFMTILSPQLIIFVFRYNQGWAWYILPSLLSCYV